MRKLYVLLGAWCVLVVAPGLAVTAGAFGDVYFRWRGARLDNAGIPTGATAAWIVGYLAQLVVFMWAARVARKQHVLAWLAASLFPWGVDWTLYGATWLVVPWSLATAGIALWIALGARRADALARHGVRATGIVLEVHEPLMNVVINNVYIKRTLRLRIEREDGNGPYEGVLDGVFMIGRIPSVGDAIPLRVDPRRPERFEAAGDAAPARTAHERPKPRDAGVAEELERLTRLRDRGAITETEFTAAKSKILGG